MRISFRLAALAAGIAISSARAAPEFADESAVPLSAPRIFAEGVVSTPADEFGGQFSPDGRTVWFNRSVPRSQLYTIFVSTFAGGHWGRPEIAGFSGRWRDYDPTLSPDGRQLFFISDRPLAEGVAHPNYDIWVLDAGKRGWGEPRRLGPPINGAWSSHFASPTRDGSLYFTSDRPGGKGPLDVWVARYVDGRYQPPVDLGAAINNEQWANFEVYVAPDESWMVVSAYGHEDSLGDCDLYVSVRRDGEWQPLRNPGPAVNSAARDYSARATPGGSYLVFASERGVPTDVRDTPWTYRQFTQAIRGVRNGLGNIYQVDLDIVLQAAAK